MHNHIILSEGQSLLLDWQRAEGRSCAWLAAQLGVRVATVSDWRTARRLPQRRLRDALEALTGGAVPASAWVRA